MSALSVGDRPITFCSIDGTLLTGGFYIRDNSPAALGGLPISVDNPNLLDADFSCFNGDPDDVIGEPNSDSYWFRSYDGAPVPLPGVETVGTNNVARISVDESSNEPIEGHYGAIYYDHEFDHFESHEHELYFLAFEVKTGCGWRSNDIPYANEDNGVFNKFKFGPHCVSARVEWFANEGGVFNLVPTGNSAPDIFYAYETTDTINGERLTRFCGRTYRPFDPDTGYQAQTARIALVVEGYMPDDEGTGYPVNTVYFDNIAFFKAPATKQVYGEDTLPGNGVKLFGDCSV